MRSEPQVHSAQSVLWAGFVFFKYGKHSKHAASPFQFLAVLAISLVTHPLVEVREAPQIVNSLFYYYY